MPAQDKAPLNKYVTVALAEEQYLFLCGQVDAGKALNVPDAIRHYIDKGREAVTI
jgi:hypothetical protein